MAICDKRSNCMPPKTPTRIPFLDGIRGYAALWVMLGHFSTRTGLRVPILQDPGIAVDLFMVVSGFLMTQHHFLRQASEPWESPRSWLIFYARRFFRIAPLYYALLIPSFLAFASLREAQTGPLKTLLNIEYHPSLTLDAGNILTHVSFLFGLFPQYYAALTMPDWSVGLEMQFYAVFPFLMLLASRWNMFRFCLLALPVWSLFRLFSGSGGVFALPSFLPLNLGVFLIGMLLAWAFMQDSGKLTPRASLLLLLMAAIAACVREQTNAAATGPIILGVSLLMALLLFYEEAHIGWGIGPWLGKINVLLGNRTAQFLANVSYGVYLLHLLVMVPVLAKLCDFSWFVQRPATARFLILTLLAGPLTYGLAWLLFWGIEKPGIRLGKALIERLRATKQHRNSDQIAMKLPLA
jgi:peptidoglycan/LPS O-acetylase OafA/YrhL